MIHLKKFNETVTFEDLLSDLFLEFEDIGYIVNITETEILKSVKTSFVIGGDNFLYLSQHELNMNKKPVPGKWMIGYVVTLSEIDPTYNLAPLSPKQIRKNKSKIRKEQLEKDDIIKLVRRKYIMIKRRSPENLFLLGAKSDMTSNYSPTIDFKFAFILE